MYDYEQKRERKLKKCLKFIRQIAIDDDWSALRFRKPEHIKTMTRKFAVTEKGKERTQ
jgi:hypothetical protein